MPRNLDLTALRSFVAVADTGGVTRAASQLNLTQSAVSMQLKRLEEALGHQLLDRANRTVSLTREGALVLSYARRMLALNDEAWGRLNDQGYEGEIVLGVPHDVVYPHIPSILRRFASEYPRVKVNLVSSYTRSLKEAFSRGELDVTMTTEQELAGDGVNLSSRQLVWCGAKQGRAWKQRPLRLAINNRCAFGPMARDALDQAGIPWEMTVDTNSAETAEASLSADLGVDARLFYRVSDDLEVIDHGQELPELPTININLYTNKLRSPELAAYLSELIIDAYSDSPTMLKAV